MPYGGDPGRTKRNLQEGGTEGRCERRASAGRYKKAGEGTKLARKNL